MNFKEIKKGDLLTLETHGKKVRVRITDKQVNEDAVSAKYVVRYEYLDDYTFMGASKGLMCSEDGQFETLKK